MRYRAGNPLHLDVLVVDEALMIDLPVISRLIDVLPAHGWVIFPGDRDQLASVETRAVLGDICAWASSGYTAVRTQELTRLTGLPMPAGEEAVAGVLRDSLYLLQKSHRPDNHSGIRGPVRAVNVDTRTEVKATLCQPSDNTALYPLSTIGECEAMLGAAQQGYKHYPQLRRERAEPRAMLAAFSEFQLLYVLRGGLYGVSGANEWLEQRLNCQRAIVLPRRSRWYNGRPIMTSCNDSVLGPLNGDIGIALERNGELRMWFLTPDGTIKSVQPSRLSEHDTAWAMTVHKSQGSEFEYAVLVLLVRSVPLVIRELVYTIITRTKQRLSLYIDEQVLSQAIVTRTEQYSGLVEIFVGCGAP